MEAERNGGFPAALLALLSPAGGSTILYNCSTCQGFEVYCWPRKRCFLRSLLPTSASPPPKSLSSEAPQHRWVWSPGSPLPLGSPIGSHDLWEARILLLFVCDPPCSWVFRARGGVSCGIRAGDSSSPLPTSTPSSSPPAPAALPPFPGLPPSVFPQVQPLPSKKVDL